ncbi:hypothetical protein [Kalamiella sp. sgz302252]|uniref:hypothetical protein n=1 Tax=Pantoea sp. sgz302252 TaxID=3341827 RepID=UPI0036D2A2FF
MLTRSSSEVNLRSATNRPARLKKSCSVHGKTRFQNKIVQSKNSPQTLTRHKNSMHINKVGLEDFLCFDSRLIYEKIRDARSLSSRNYIYLGSVQAMPVNEQGVTLNSDGNLLLIKGKSRNLISGLCKKYTKGLSFQTALLRPAEDKKSLQFASLFLNDEGVLIGKEKGSGKLFSISFNKNNNITDEYTDTESINVNYELYHGANPEELTFKTQENECLSFRLKEGKLLLDSVSHNDKKYNYALLSYDIKLPLSNKTKIASIKKSQNRLQIELLKNNKKRIVYLDPCDISLKDLSAKRVSHKPAQSLSGRLGTDPHEKYFSGQPFSSSRLGNFSSRYLPLFSYTTDNFRTHLKQAKEAKIAGETSTSFLACLRSVDPGVEAIYKTGKNLINHAAQERKIKVDSKDAAFDKNSKILSYQQKRFDELLQAVNRKNAGNLPVAIADLIEQMRPGDELAFNLNDRVSLFSGIAGPGIPFVTGWFVGIVAAVASSHQLTLVRGENGKIRFCFENKSRKSAIPLAGTGQGLEDIAKLYSNHGVDYLTVMPLEALVIIALNATKGDNFSFELAKDQVTEFLDAFLNPAQTSAATPLLLKEAELKKTEEYEVVARLEAKAELRPEVGTMVNSSTYMVVPRTALGAGVGLDLARLKKITQTHFNDSAPTVKTRTQLDLLKTDFEIYHEQKIMPITMSMTASHEVAHCFPLPLQEEKTTHYRAESKPLFTAQSNKEVPLVASSKVKNTSKQDFLSVAMQEEMNASGIKRDILKAKSAMNNTQASSPLSTCHPDKDDETLQIHSAACHDDKPVSDSSVTSSILTELREAIVKALPERLTKTISPRGLAHQPIRISAQGKVFSAMKDEAVTSSILAKTRSKLKRLRQFCSEQERNNMHKTVVSVIESNYELSAQDKARRARLLAETAAGNSESMMKIKQELARLKENAQYCLSDIKLKRISAQSIKASMPLAILNCTHESQLAYQQDLGSILFEYERDKLLPTRVIDRLKCLI